MGKKCPNCSEINYDSAVICSRCKASLRNAEYIPVQNGLTTKAPQKNAVEKSSKVLISIIVVIAVLIVSLIIVFITVNLNVGTDDLEAADKNMQENYYSTEENNGNMIEGVNDLPAENWEEYIAVESVNIDRTECDISVEDTVILGVSVYPENATNKIINWSVDDESIATVDENGKVTGIAAGKTIIYAVADDNGVYAECEIRVTNKNKLVEPDSLANYGRYIVKADTYLSLRYGPSVKYEEILKIDNKQVVTVYAYQNDENSNTWAYVKYESKFGWVYDNFLLSETQNSEAITDSEDNDG